jgi:hypothetical protein
LDQEICFLPGTDLILSLFSTQAQQLSHPGAALKNGVGAGKWRVVIGKCNIYELKCLDTRWETLGLK